MKKGKKLPVAQGKPVVTKTATGQNACVSVPTVQIKITSSMGG